MIKKRGLCLSVLLGLFVLAVPAHSAVPADGALPARIAVGNAPSAPEPVTPWDPASPQRLVRIDGVLYQEDAGYYYRTIENRVTVRLVDGVQDWKELVRLAQAAAPQSFSGLERLSVGRANHLGILDLVLPSGAATDWCETIFRTGLVRFAEVPTIGVYLAVPDDDRYDEQWALNNTGQTGGTPGADIAAEAAWELTAGDPSIIVAVLDSGTDIDHEDLAANVWHNDGEIPDNGIDDDANGYTDDWEGWDFGNNDNDPTSSNYHGTHVAGIIFGVSDNGIGIAGLAGGLGGPGVRGMALGVGSSAPDAGVLDDAIIYAADNGAQVITMSLSVGPTTAINDALDYAYNTRDVFIDCASGNNGSSVGYPANRPEVMAVASTTDDDNKSSFSNPGPEVEVAAPGSSILSTRLNNSYGSGSGTSFAAPYVAALAGLVRGLNPGLPAPDVRQLIIDTVDDIEAPGYDVGTGFGRINAFAAVSGTATSDGAVRLDTDRYSCDDETTITVTDIDLAGQGSVTITLRSGVEPSGESVSLVETGPGSGVFRGSLATSGAAPAADGLLQVTDADSIDAEYLDLDDGHSGTSVLKFDAAVTDCAGPLIQDVEVLGADDDSVTVVFSTDEAGTGVVRYGQFTPPAQVASSSGLTTIHSLQLTGLDECTSYRYAVESTDDLGNVSIDDNSGLYFSFETLTNLPGVGLVPCHQGQASLDKNAYSCTDTAQITVTDIDLDTDPGVVETIQVLLTSTTEPAGEWVTLTEVTSENSRFDGSIVFDAAAVSGDTKLGLAAGDLVTVTYYDGDDGDGAARTTTFTSVADCIAPAIRDVRVTTLTATQATVEWNTDEPGTSRLEYGPTAALGTMVEDLQLKTAHRLVISPFDSCDRVHFRVSSTDILGDVRVADAAGLPFQLNTQQIGGVVFHDNFEIDTGWFLPGEWERGTPQGLGTGSGDADAAYSGSRIIGNDLNGEGAFPGDYETLIKNWVVSPSITTTGSSNLELILRRKLGVVSDDSAGIAVYKPGQFVVWTNGSAIDDADWTEMRVDISEHADDRSGIQIGFGMESEEPGQSYGWNIDEVIVKDSTQPDYLGCADCSGTPAFSGLTAVYDPDPCGASGLTLAWEISPAWGTGDGGSYEVYRDTSPGFSPNASNRVASGLTGTIWTDANAPLDVEVWYVVRARNDESCAGGVGLDDGNSVRLSATETIAQSAAGALGETVRVDRVGAAHVRLAWLPVAGADRYSVRRSLATDFGGAVEIGTTAGLFFEDANAVADGNFYSYRIVPLNACGDEAP